jgi:hypothetical protein
MTILKPLNLRGENMEKLTDNEIVKALECCWHSKDCVGNECPLFEPVNDCAQLMAMEALDLINRQQAEVERLQKEVDRLSQIVLYNDGIVSDLEKDLFNAKAEAIKELMFNLDEEISTYSSNGKGLNVYAWLKNYVKEMGLK